MVGDSGFHFGYWRDCPAENPVFVASNTLSKGGQIHEAEANIFAALKYAISDQSFFIKFSIFDFFYFTI